MTRVSAKRRMQYRYSAVNQGMRNLLRDNPWPDFDYGSIEPFVLPLGSSRAAGIDLILAAIADHNVVTMVEIGVFVGGRSRRWLDSQEDLVVIGVDMWDYDWDDYVAEAAKFPTGSWGISDLSDTEIKEIGGHLRQHGNFRVCMNNLDAYRDRFFPVRRIASEALTNLKDRHIAVDLIYVDGFRRSTDLEKAHELFPDAILCGENWQWPDSEGRLAMQEIVKTFAAVNGLEVETSEQVWVLRKPTAKADLNLTTAANQGLTNLRRDNPWPEFDHGTIKPFHLSLDGNGQAGREIIEKILIDKDIKTMVEVGVFLGGSARQWLKCKKDLLVIGVDPWNHNWADYLADASKDPVQSRSFSAFTETEVAEIVTNIRDHGNFQVALNNMREFQDRFVPVRRFSPEALVYLKARQIDVELIYIDAFKRSLDLEKAYELYPDAILCGDDWLWPDANGKLVMQDIVKAFAAAHGFEVESKRQSWVLHKPAA